MIYIHYVIYVLYVDFGHFSQARIWDPVKKL